MKKRKSCSILNKSGMTGDYSTKRISNKLISDIKKALRDTGPYGSVEIYVQNSLVTQITTRRIEKTNNNKNKGK